MEINQTGPKFVLVFYSNRYLILQHVFRNWKLYEVVIYFLPVGFLWPGMIVATLHLFLSTKSHKHRCIYDIICQKKKKQQKTCWIWWTFTGTQFTGYQWDLHWKIWMLAFWPSILFIHRWLVTRFTDVTFFYMWDVYLHACSIVLYSMHIVVFYKFMWNVSLFLWKMLMPFFYLLLRVLFYFRTAVALFPNPAHDMYYDRMGSNILDKSYSSTRFEQLWIRSSPQRI